MTTLKQQAAEYRKCIEAEDYFDKEIGAYSDERGYIQGFTDAFNWISVEDELPLEGKKVLTKGESGSIKCEYFEELGTIRFERWSNSCDWKVITHWRYYNLEDYE